MTRRSRVHQGISEIAKAGKHRWEDAQTMLRAGRWRGAMYVAGYTVECALKTKLMTRLQCRNLKGLDEVLHRRGILAKTLSVFTHQLEVLLQLTGSSDRPRNNPQMWANF